MAENCTTQHGYGETGNPGCLPHTGGIDLGVIGAIGALAIFVAIVMAVAVKAWQEFTG